MISPKTLALFFIVAFVSVQAATNPNVTSSIFEWSDAAFNSLLNNVSAVTFDTQKLEVIKAALGGSSFDLAGYQVTQLYDSFIQTSDLLALTPIIQNNTYEINCQQLTYILDKIGFSSNRLDTLKSLVPYLTDKANNQTILDTFLTSAQKDQALQIIATSNSGRKSYLFGQPQGNIAFVIDISNEIFGQFTLSNGQNMTRLDLVKSELTKALQGLSPSDNFVLLPYNYITYNVQSSLKPATQANIDAALSYMNSWTPQNSQSNAYGALQAAFQMSGVKTAYLVTYNLPDAAVKDTSKIVSSVKDWYAQNPVTVNTIGLMLGSYYPVDKQATENYLKSVANVTNGSYKGFIYQ